MEDINDLIRECVYSTPLVLLSLIENDKSLIEKVNEYLPYSTGFEIECARNDEVFDVDNFKNIPNILDVGIDSWEQRFRIPSGINGLICLYNISNQLKYNSTLNEGSGIHYHIDMTECYKDIASGFISSNSKWIIKELESWEYKGSYNTKKCGYGISWLRYNGRTQTAEFRIGEMTFDYELLIKRIIHCNAIVKRLKRKLSAPPTPINTNIVTVEDLIEYNKNLKYVATEETLKLKAILSSLEEEEKVDNTEESEMNKIIKQRVVKL